MGITFPLLRRTAEAVEKSGFPFVVVRATRPPATIRHRLCFCGRVVRTTFSTGPALGLGIFLLLLAVPLFSCKPKQDFNALAHSVHVDAFMKKKLESELGDIRMQKNQYFKTSNDSPLPVHLKPVFTGLEYYGPDWRYRFEGPVIRYPNPAKFQIITTSGVWRDAVRYGYVRFALNRKEFKLEVYRLLDLQEKDLLFVPFVDANVGKETYPAGRYIDLVEKPDGRYVIDFNTAYNPSCAYGGNFPCPVTPKENHLPIAIPAGEKILSIAAALEKSKTTL